jgi:hypothetical protein
MPNSDWAERPVLASIVNLSSFLIDELLLGRLGKTVVVHGYAPHDRPRFLVYHLIGNRASFLCTKAQRNCRSDGWQYGLVLQQLVCAFDYAMRRSSWMHVQGPSSAISHAPRTLRMSHVPNNDDF